MIEPMFLGLDEIIEIHRDQISRSGGMHGIRDLDLLKSAVAIPAAGFGGDYLHADIYEMVAVYLFNIVRNHPFVDGNKRTGIVCALVFLIMNGVGLEPDENSLEQLVRDVAEGKFDKSAIARFFRENRE